MMVVVSYIILEHHHMYCYILNSRTQQWCYSRIYFCCIVNYFGCYCNIVIGLHSNQALQEQKSVWSLNVWLILHVHIFLVVTENDNEMVEIKLSTSFTMRKETPAVIPCWMIQAMIVVNGIGKLQQKKSKSQQQQKTTNCKQSVKLAYKVM